MSKAWSVLSKVDVSEHIEKKGKLSYLSWAWAWGVLVENYPESNYEFLPNEMHSDGSVTVHSSLTVDGVTRSMWLPVMDNRNNSIQNPSSRNISDAKMRCLVKNIAMFGLGHYIYAGEDVPSDDAPKEVQTTITAVQLDELFALADEVGADFDAFAKYLKVNKLAELPASKFAGAMSALESKRQAA